MEIIGLIAIIIILVLVFSALGWGLKISEWILKFIGEGCSTSWGCFIWILAIIIFIMIL